MTRHNPTSTLTSIVPAAPLKVDWYWTMIAVVKVSNRIIAKAPYSASRCRPTSRAPPVTASRRLRQDHPEEPNRTVTQGCGRLLEKRVEPEGGGHGDDTSGK